MQNAAKKVIVGMSGGVDSSVAALLLKQQGYEVIGVMMKLSDPPQGVSTKHVSCCSIEDASDARRVSEQLGLPFYVVNSKDVFKQAVIEPFVKEYLSGVTPNPCVRCNDKVKFEHFFAKAKELGADYIATGHYVRREYDEETSSWRLFQADDLNKDQSYFLFTMNQQELAHTLFPLAHLTKSQVRAIAREHGLKTSEKAESQEICFVADNDHGGFIDRYLGAKPNNLGSFVDSEGKVLGEHQGIHHYTIGQRRGTGVAAGKKVYVKSIDPVSHQIELADDASLFTAYLTATDVRWIRQPASGSKINAKIRYRHAGSVATLEYQQNDKAKLIFTQAQRAVTPGQAVVFYEGNEVLGGGWIA